MTFKGFHHIAIRVRDFDAAIRDWQEKFGLELDRTAENEALGAKQAFFLLPDGGFIEIVAPLTEDSAIAKALDSRGEGVHVVSMSVDDPQQTLDGLSERGVALAGTFVHPKSANGVMFGVTDAPL